MVAPQQQFCVRWNSYHTNLQSAFPKLLTSEHFVDVTLACDNGLIKCHKVVLSACSNYFENIFIQNPCQHPTIILKDMKCNEVQALVDFMYKGEVNVTQDDLPSLLKAAESLQIRGLSGSEQCLNQMNILSQTASTPPCPPLTPVTPNIDLMATVPSTTNESDTPTPVATISTPNNNSSISKERIINLNTPESDDKNTDTVADLSIKPEISTPSFKEEQSNDVNYESQNESENDDKSKTESIIKEEDIGYNDDDIEMDSIELDDDYTGNEHMAGTSDENGQSSDFVSANVSCLYAKRIRRSEIELKQAADCITRGQTFQNVSDQFNIPISTIRFFMARKGILPRRKRGRSSSANMMGNNCFQSNSINTTDRSGASSPTGPPFHIAHYKLPKISPKLN